MFYELPFFSLEVRGVLYFPKHDSWFFHTVCLSVVFLQSLLICGFRA